MFKWDYAPVEDIRERMNKLAMDAIGKIIFEETEENPDREIKFERITGIMFLLAEIDEDMSTSEEEKGPTLGDVMHNIGESVKEFNKLCNMAHETSHPWKENGNGTDS